MLHRDRFILYEVGNVYRPAPDGCDQPKHCAAVGYVSEKAGKLQDLFLYLKGAVEEMTRHVNAGTLLFGNIDDTSKPWQGTATAMNIVLNGEVVGTIGYLAPPFLDIYEKGAQVVWFEVSLDALPGSRYPEMTYEEIPVYPGSWMDFSIVADRSMGYAGLASLMGQVSHPVLKDFRFLYLYDGKGLPEGKISFTFRFWLGLRERTLTSDDLSDFRSVFLQFLKNHGLSLR